MKYIKPEVFSKSFTCPHCGVVAMQYWWVKSWDGSFNPHIEILKYPFRVGTCQHCNKNTIWIEDTMYFPDTGIAPLPNPDMPESVLKIYAEASSISSKSPRGAAALLRLSIQVLCKELGETGKNINTDIGNLVIKGLPIIVQQSLDIVRVTGNDAVHPGQVDTDNPETVAHLFKLVNIIIEYMITLPNQVNQIYATLPDDKVQGIIKRDGN